MILTGPEIDKALLDGSIGIDPFNPKQLNPNSYNVKLFNRLRIYKKQENKLNSLILQDGLSLFDDVPKQIFASQPFDPKVKEETVDLYIPSEGLVIYPGILYLGRTVEFTTTSYPFVPMLEGRSSWGRLGLTVHITAGFGDVGYSGTWTLEIACVHEIRLYPDMEIAQLYWAKTVGDRPTPYSGKYQNEVDALPSKMHEEFH